MKLLHLILVLCCSVWLLSSNVLASEISIPNNGFENDLNSWPLATTFKDNVNIANEQAHSGTKSLHLQSTPAHSSVMLFQTINHISGDTVYHLSAQVKSGDAPNGSVTAVIKLEYYNAAGKNTSGVNGRLSLPPNSDWTPINVTARADTDTTRVKIYARLMSKGELYFDDFKLEKPDIQLLPPTRLQAVAGKPVPVKLRVWTDQAWPENQTPPITLKVTGPGGEKIITPQITRESDQQFSIGADLPPIASGYYEFHALLNGATSPTAARTYMTVENRQPQNLSETGTLLHNGKPFFPIGIYHPENFDYYNRGNTDTIDSSYKLLAENGFNTVQGSSTNNLDTLQTYLDTAQKYDLAVDVPLYGGGKVKDNLAVSLQKIARFKNHPAVLNWKISDEPDLQPKISGEVPEVYAALKKADAIHPLGVTLATDNAIPDWAAFTDIIQLDRYPIPGTALTRVADFTRIAVRDKAAPWQNVSFVLQCGWKPDLSNQPTVAQARSMVYLALIEGAKGIWWYSMYDPKWDITQTPLWPHLKEINAEIKVLSEPLMLGENVSGISCDNTKVLFTARKYKGKTYLLITNPEDAATQVTFRLPETARYKNAQTLDDKSTFTIQNQQLKLNLDAIDSFTLILQ